MATLKPKVTKDKVEFLAQDLAIRRVMIMKDIIAQTKAKTLFGITGQYIGKISDTYIDSVIFDNQANSKELSSLRISEYETCLAIQAQEPCACCIKGSITLSRIGYQHPVDTDCKEDQMTDGTIDINRDTCDLDIANDFSTKQLTLMENCYERSYGLNDDILNDVEIDAANDYGESLDSNNTKRIVQICKNVIRNNGEFVIPKKYYTKDQNENINM